MFVHAGGGLSESASAAAPTAAPSAAPATSAPSAAASAAPSGGAAGGQLTYTIMNDFPSCFHPICFQTGGQFSVFEMLYSGLVKRDQTEKIIPSLAEKWDVSPDATTFTFHLNKDAKWSDGQPVTADDVVFTVTEAQKDKDIYAKNGTYAITAWLATKTVEAVDPNTVKFTLNAPELRVPREPDGPGTHDHAQARSVRGRRRQLTTRTTTTWARVSWDPVRTR